MRLQFARTADRLLPTPSSPAYLSAIAVSLRTLSGMVSASIATYIRPFAVAPMDLAIDCATSPDLTHGSVFVPHRTPVSIAYFPKVVLLLSGPAWSATDPTEGKTLTWGPLRRGLITVDH